MDLKGFQKEKTTVTWTLKRTVGISVAISKVIKLKVWYLRFTILNTRLSVENL